MKTTKLNDGTEVFANEDGSAMKATNRKTAEKQLLRILEAGRVSAIIQPRLGPVFFQMVVR